MILSDTLNQPLALAIYALLGIIFGIIYTLNFFVCAFMIKNSVYRHISQGLYVVLYGVAIFLVTFIHFSYDLKVYHLIICSLFSVLVSTALYLPIKKHRSVIMTKCDTFKRKLAQSRLVKRFKK